MIDFYSKCDIIFLVMCMSLTNPFGIKERRIKGVIKECIPDKNDFYLLDGTKCFDAKTECAVFSELSTTDATLCGIAFDYLARFFVARKILNNKEEALINLCAEGIFSVYGHSFYSINFDVDNLKKIGITVTSENESICGGCNFYLQKKLNTDREEIDRLKNKGFLKISYLDKERVCSLKENYFGFLEDIRDFVFEKNNNEDELIKKCVVLAHLEQINRSSTGAKMVDELFDFSDQYIKVFRELHRLLDSFKRTFLPLVKPESDVVFNPGFSIGSRLVGGADSDIFVDGTLYDFKVIKNNGWSSTYATQVIGYYLLDLFAKKCGDWKSDLYYKEIDRVALYNVRYEKIYYLDCNKLNKTVIDNAIRKISDTYILYKVFYFVRRYDDIIEKYKIPINDNNCLDWNEQRAEELERYIKKKESGTALQRYQLEKVEVLLEIKERITRYIETVDTLSIIRDMIKEDYAN